MNLYKPVRMRVVYASLAILTLCFTLLVLSLTSASQDQERLVGLLPQAEQNDPVAQYELAKLYLDKGSDVFDPKLAQMWLERSSNSDYVPALVYLADLNASSEVTGKGLEKAAEFYERAAVLGSAYAQYKIGLGYRDGTGVKADRSQAESWLQKALSQGEGSAAYALGVLAENDKNLVAAEKYYLQGSDLNNAPSRLGLARLYLNGADDKKAQGVELLLSAANAGLPEAQYNLGHSYLTGSFTEQNPILAGSWIGKAAAQNIEPAMAILKRSEERCLESTTHNSDTAFSCLVALGGDNPEIKFIVGTFYRAGAFVAKDEMRAAELLHLAANQGNIKAQFLTMMNYDRGIGVNKDPLGAFIWSNILQRMPDYNNTLSSLGVTEAEADNVFNQLKQPITAQQEKNANTIIKKRLQNMEI